MTGEEMLEVVRGTLDACARGEACHLCPIATDDNDTECANYLAKVVLDADVSDCVMKPWGLMEARYADAVQPE